MREAVRREGLVEAGLLDDDGQVDFAATEEVEPPQERAASRSVSTPAIPVADVISTGPVTAPTTPVAGIISTDSPARNRNKKQSHKNRCKKRKAADAGLFSHHDARPKVKAKYVTDEHALPSNAKLDKARVASTAYVGLQDQTNDRRVYTLEELVGPASAFNFKLVEYRKGTVVPIVSADDKHYVIGVFADTPPDNDWDKTAAEAAELLEKARTRCEMPDDDRPHRRGAFATLTCGVSFGNGMPEPKNLRLGDLEGQVAMDLNAQAPFRRLAGFATSIMATWSPKLYEYYVSNLGALQSHSPHLRRNFPGTVFMASTYNLGPVTACYRHTDCMNLPFGWCAITALGDYDFRKGGHIILWEAGLVIEFPPGTTILIPSAAISHSNTAIAPGERRYSFTQYTAGGLFRWVQHGFRKASTFWNSLEDDEVVVEKAKDEQRWKMGMGLWMKLKDLKVKL